MPILQTGDIVIRGATDEGFDLLEAITEKHIGGRFQSLPVALAFARTHINGGTIWQQSVDHRGRLLGDLLQLPKFPLDGGSKE